MLRLPTNDPESLLLSISSSWSSSSSMLMFDSSDVVHKNNSPFHEWVSCGITANQSVSGGLLRGRRWNVRNPHAAATNNGAPKPKEINQIEVFYIPTIYSRFLIRGPLSSCSLEGNMLRANVVCLGARRDNRTTVVGWFEDEGKCLVTCSHGVFSLGWCLRESCGFCDGNGL